LEQKESVLKTHLIALVVAICLLGAFAFAKGQTEQTQETVSPGELGEPQYGGTLTYVEFSGEDAPSPDPVEPATWPSENYYSPCLHRILRPDVETYGPRGTGEYHFAIDKAPPLKFSEGALIESWQVTVEKLVFKVRKGIYWQPSILNPNVLKQPREFVAQDIAYHFNRLIESPMGVTIKPKVTRIYAQDKYTVVIETPRLFVEWEWDLSSRWGASIYARESVEAGSSSWENLISTGPFILKERVPGSYHLYVKNPNYYRSTTVNGKEYDDIPFIEELNMPFIADEATQVSALRTGKLDAHIMVPYQYEQSLAKTSPELQKGRVTWADPYVCKIRTDRGPLANKKVRQALMVGADLDYILEAVMPGGEQNWSPIAPGAPGYVPMEDMPRELRMLYEYDPERAKKMMVEAGYPNGFEATMMITGHPVRAAVLPPAGEMLASMWSELGVKVNIRIDEPVVFTKHIIDKTQPELTLDCIGGSTTLPLSVFSYAFLPGGERNMSMYDNPKFNELYYKAVSETDPAKREELIRRMNLTVIEDVAEIPLGNYFLLSYWWPWVKNYYGEADGIGRIQPPLESLWIDQGLKKQMGY
jgi:peptide/nickel transport system substrate-binding protein